MTRIASRGAMGLKAEKVKPDPDYLARVRQLPCRCCGRHGPNEAHHCRDRPDYDEQGLYKRVPGTAMRAHDHDAIPLCLDCHRMFHLNRTEFHQRAGVDYSHIGPVRALLADMEIDF